MMSGCIYICAIFKDKVLFLFFPWGWKSNHFLWVKMDFFSPSFIELFILVNIFCYSLKSSFLFNKPMYSPFWKSCTASSLFYIISQDNPSNYNLIFTSSHNYIPLVTHFYCDQLKKKTTTEIFLSTLCPVA